MAIWEFNNYDIDELNEIQNHIKALENLGIQYDDDMVRELEAEIKMNVENEEKNELL